MQIRAMRGGDRDAVLSMMRVFYTSAAVWTDGSEEIYRNDIDACLSDSPYLEGYILEENGLTAGYAMLAKSFSTEFGKPCVWIEDIYVQPEFRSRGFGPQFLAYARERYPKAVLRLEVETENTHACHVYRRSGYEELPYTEMLLGR